MRDEMTGRETLDPETVAPVIDPSHEIEAGAASELEQVKGERDQLLDRLATAAGGVRQHAQARGEGAGRTCGTTRSEHG